MSAVLSDVEIEKLVVDGELVITPFKQDNLRSSSYVLTLDSTLLVLSNAYRAIDVSESLDTAAYFTRRNSHQGRLTVHPGEFCLASSMELVSMPASHAGLLSFGSRLARVGLAANNGSNLVHANYGDTAASSITFELFNPTELTIVLKVGMPFCHLSILRHEIPASRADHSVNGTGPGPKTARFGTDG